MPPKLSKTAQLTDVQRLSGLDVQEWLNFLVSTILDSRIVMQAESTQRITRDVAIQARKDPDIGPWAGCWDHMSIVKRAQIYQEAEQKLQEHGIVQVNERLVRWRLAQVLHE
jgi:hypothetical protein